MIRIVALNYDINHPCVYDNSDNTVRLPSGEWVDLGKVNITHEFKMPKEGSEVILRKDMEKELEETLLKALMVNYRGERVALFKDLDSCGNFPYNGYYFHIEWFELDIEGETAICEVDPKEVREHTKPVPEAPKRGVNLPSKGRILLLTKYVK